MISCVFCTIAERVQNPNGHGGGSNGGTQRHSAHTTTLGRRRRADTPSTRYLCGRRKYTTRVRFLISLALLCVCVCVHVCDAHASMATGELTERVRALSAITEPTTTERARARARGDREIAAHIQPFNWRSASKRALRKTRVVHTARRTTNDAVCCMLLRVFCT